MIYFNYEAASKFQKPMKVLWFNLAYMRKFIRTRNIMILQWYIYDIYMISLLKQL